MSSLRGAPPRGLRCEFHTSGQDADMNTTAQGTARAFTRTPLFEALARTGYAARGLIYIVIGALAFRLAQGVGGQPANQKGALRTVAHQPFGHWILLAVAIGLAGYAIWRLTQAIVGTTPEAGKHSTLDRIGALGSAIAYGSFCVIAIALLRGSGSGASKSPSRRLRACSAGPADASS